MAPSAGWENVLKAIYIGVVALLIAACSPAAPLSPTNPPPPTSRFATFSGPVTRQTLPPTWTPSPTPTATAVPTITNTPTPAPTLSVAAICDGFRLLYDFTGRSSYTWDSYIPIVVTLEAADVWVFFSATHRLSGDRTGFELPGQQTLAVEFQMDALPQPGTYDWILGVRSNQHGDICTQTGTFREYIPPTPEATPEVTSGPVP